MLRGEPTGRLDSKADWNRPSQPFLEGRSNTSIEFDRRNCGAVPVGLGLPYIDGHKPSRINQRAALPKVQTRIARGQGKGPARTPRPW